MVRGANPPARNFCFTLYAEEALPDDAQQAWLTERALHFTEHAPDFVRFLICQLERGSESGRLHLQGYVESRRAVRFSALQRGLERRLSLRESLGSADANIVYCSKEEGRVAGPWRVGVPVRQGQRTDLEAVRQAVANQVSENDLWEQHFPVMVKYHRAISEYVNIRHRATTPSSAAGTEPPLQRIDVYVYWGDTGLGKSRRARYEAHHPFIVSAGVKNDIWFDGYTPGRDIIIDEYNGQLPINWLKRLLDNYEFELPVKCRMVPRGARRIFLTSNEDPRHWYPAAGIADVAALMRRLGTIIQFTQPWTPPVPVAAPECDEPAAEEPDVPRVHDREEPAPAAHPDEAVP